MFWVFICILKSELVPFEDLIQWMGFQHDLFLLLDTLCFNFNLLHLFLNILRKFPVKKSFSIFILLTALISLEEYSQVLNFFLTKIILLYKNIYVSLIASLASAASRVDLLAQLTTGFELKVFPSKLFANEG